MRKAAAKYALTWAAAWFGCRVVFDCLWHGQVLREELVEPFVVSVILGVFIFFLQLYRARSGTKPEKQDAA
jgi:hypothetical protein